MPKLAVFGGTGMTGQSTVEYALEKGLVVRMLYRTPETIPESIKDRVELVQGDVTNIEDVKRTLDGTDYATVVLGTRNKLEPTTVLSTGMNNIIAAMKESGMRRVSVCLSSFLLFPAGTVPKPFEHLNAEHQAMLDATKASGLDYIAVLPPHIANEPSGPVTIEHDKSPGRIVSKLDLAKFLVDSLDMKEHWGKVVGIAKKL